MMKYRTADMFHNKDALRTTLSSAIKLGEITPEQMFSSPSLCKLEGNKR